MVIFHCYVSSPEGTCILWGREVSKFFRNFQGIQNLRSESIDVSKTIRIRSVQTWRSGKPNITQAAFWGSPPGHLGQEVACIQQGLQLGSENPWDFPWKNHARKPLGHCPTSSTSRATESSRAHALFHVFYILHSYAYTHIYIYIYII